MNTLLLILITLASQSAQAGLTVYTDRPTARLQPAADRFESLTGQKVKFIEASYNDLSKRLDSEGQNSPADLLITKDLVFLGDAVKNNFLQPMRLTPSVQKVALALRDSASNWVALTFRARTMAYDPSRVNAAEIESYDDLADAKWAGRLCLRSSKSSYNQALTSYLVATRGESATLATLKGWIENLAAPVFANDTALLEAIAVGTCDVGVVNHYYLAQLHAKNPNFPVKIKFLDQKKGGTHLNGAGIGIVRASKQQELAQKFIDLVLSDEFQLQISAGHFDYPAVSNLLPSSLIKEWGAFRGDSTPWSELSNHIPAANSLMKEAGYN